MLLLTPNIFTNGNKLTFLINKNRNNSSGVFIIYFPLFWAATSPMLCADLVTSQAYCAELSCYDYHRMCKSSSNIDAVLSQDLLPEIQDFKKTHGFYVSCDGHPTKMQTATIRTNCLDCLDRTNSVQGFLGRQVQSCSSMCVSRG